MKGHTFDSLVLIISDVDHVEKFTTGRCASSSILNPLAYSWLDIFDDKVGQPLVGTPVRTELGLYSGDVAWSSKSVTARRPPEPTQLATLIGRQMSRDLSRNIQGPSQGLKQNRT